MRDALLNELRLLWAWGAARVELARQDEDRGEIVQTVVIIAAFVAAAIIIVAILVTKATDAANNVKTN
ncbi:MAG: hypothetical protein M3Y42_11840 [Actinomycetota bacterium]|nr:hypothetical protein [Actinomycetota bacterium]MDQ2957644.1 hypothetical protein [Actinomycetota bacterium]